MRVPAWLTAAIVCVPLACSPKTTAQTYGDHIRYVKWTSFDEVVHSTVSAPKDLLTVAQIDRAGVELPTDLAQRVWTSVARIKGVSVHDAQASVKKLSLEETIALDRDVVASLFTYTRVDEEPFTTQHGRGLALSQYVALGVGDCAQYAQSFNVVFDILQHNNPRLRDVVVTRGRLGGARVPHDWNAIAVPTPTELLISHVDVSDYDDNGVFEGEAVTHYPTNTNEFIGNVYLTLSDPKLAFEYREKRYEELRQEYNNALHEWKAGDATADDRRMDVAVKILLLLEDVALDGYLERDLNVLSWARDVSLQLTSRPPADDQMLYYSIIAAQERGYPKSAVAFRSLLESRYPQSTWLKELKSDTQR